MTWYMRHQSPRRPWSDRHGANWPGCFLRRGAIARTTCRRFPCKSARSRLHYFALGLKCGHAVDAKWSATFSVGVIPDTLVQDRDVALSALRQFEGSAQIQGRFLSRVGHDAAPVRYRKSRPVDLNTGGSRALALTSSSESARRRVASGSSLRFGLITVAPR